MWSINQIVGSINQIVGCFNLTNIVFLTLVLTRHNGLCLCDAIIGKIHYRAPEECFCRFLPLCNRCCLLYAEVANVHNIKALDRPLQRPEGRQTKWNSTEHVRYSRHGSNVLLECPHSTLQLQIYKPVNSILHTHSSMWHTLPSVGADGCSASAQARQTCCDVLHVHV